MKSVDPFLLTFFETSLSSAETFARIDDVGQRFDNESTSEIVEGISEDKTSPTICICPISPSRYGPLTSLMPHPFPKNNFSFEGALYHGEVESNQVFHSYFHILIVSMQTFGGLLLVG